MLTNIGSMTPDLLGGGEKGRGSLSLCCKTVLLLIYKSRLLSMCENNSLIFLKNYQLYFNFNFIYRPLLFWYAMFDVCLFDFNKYLMFHIYCGWAKFLQKWGIPPFDLPRLKELSKLAIMCSRSIYFNR